jgi:hypothetical protein
MVAVDVKNYAVGDGEVNVKCELCNILNTAGVYDNGDMLCLGVGLSKRIGECDSDTIEFTTEELNLVKHVINILMTRSQPPLGGPRFNELIMRIFKAGK